MHTIPTKHPISQFVIRIYIIETHNFDSTMNKKVTNRVSQSLDSYLVEVGKHSLQTVEEQTELAHRIKRGDEKALSELIAGNPLGIQISRNT